MKITPEKMEAVYELLSLCEPFCDWPLPDANEVKFVVFRCKTHTGDAEKVGEQWRIRINESWCGSLTGVIRVMMHEMCHVAHGEACPNDYAHHGKWFKALASEVCRAHLLDLKAF